MADTTGAIGTGKPVAIAGETKGAYNKRVAKWAKVQADADWTLANPAAAKSGKTYTWANVPSRWEDLTDAKKLDAMAGQMVHFTTGVIRVKSIILACPCKGDDMLDVQKKALALALALGKALA